MGRVRIGPSGKPVNVPITEAISVLTASDFPAPVNGFITLEKDSSWTVVNDIDVSPSTFILGAGVAIQGAITGKSGLRTDSATPLLQFDGDDSDGRSLSNLQLSNPSGQCWRFDNVNVVVLIESVQCLNSAKVGTLSGLDFVCVHGLFICGCEDGLTLDGANSFIRLNECLVREPTEDFRAIRVLPTFSCTEMLVHLLTMNVPASGFALEISDSATVVQALITNCQFPGAGKALREGAGYVTPATPLWKFRANHGVRDSANLGDARYVSALITGTLVPVSGIDEWSDTGNIQLTLATSERFALIGTNVLEFQGDEPGNFTLLGQMIASHGGGGNDLFDITVASKAPGGVWEPALGSTSGDIHQVRGSLDSTDPATIFTTFDRTDVLPGTQFRINIRNKGATAGAEVFSLCLKAD